MRVSSLENIRQLETKIEYTFKKKSLLKEALTHKSFAKEQKEAAVDFNERLEFLGDSVLELIISEYLFSDYPEYTEAQLSKIKAYAVKETTLAETSSRLGIGDHLLLGKGEDASGGRKKPSLLANAFESVLAAVYLDGGFEKARAFALGNLDTKIDNLIKGNVVFDFKTSFQEAVQERLGVLPGYRVRGEEGPEHRKTFEVEVFVKKDFYGTGRGKSKKEAEQQAARAGLKKLENR
ncbi:MAG TPA: ribonuclease III [Nitrospirae bacterium]|nr:ribonuclease 3 [bacterium BMS3Abin10]GBE39152.1 ribonuclease 3 [bacterium BMS3Bbin08]HDH51641.1 ribonuclease III [Nitrospirota bacterium]HDK82078.1 ribonuclease III [Nitrospirota bacterium]